MSNRAANSCRPSSPVCSRAPRSPRYRRALPRNAFPDRTIKRRKAAIGITGSSILPNVTAGTCEKKARSFRNSPRRIRPPPRNRLYRKRNRPSSSRSPTHMPSCHRIPVFPPAHGLRWQPPTRRAQTPPPATAAVANTPAPVQSSVIASRWPDQPDASSPAGPQPAAASPVANAPSQAATPRSVAPVTLAAADATSKSQFGSIQMLLTVVMGACRWLP